MKWSTLAAAMVVTLAPLASQASAAPHDDHAKREMTLRGCVMPAEKKGTFLLTNVNEVPSAGQAVMPEMAHGRRVVYWLKDLKNIDNWAGHTVEVQGQLEEFKNSEIEMKSGRQKNGELYVEFEGPGKDVKVPAHAVGATVGTAGRVTPEKNDIKTMLAVVKVKNVTPTDDTCK